MLTLSEQLKIVNDELKPDLVSDLLVDLTHASGINAARDFNPNHKTFDTVDNSDPSNPIAKNVDANAYLTKMLNATSKMISADSNGLVSLKIVMVSLISNATFSNGTIPITAQLIKDATKAEWEGFINDNIIKALELFAGVKVQEKTQYNSPE